MMEIHYDNPQYARGELDHWVTYRLDIAVCPLFKTDAHVANFVQSKHVYKTHIHAHSTHHCTFYNTKRYCLWFTLGLAKYIVKSSTSCIGNITQVCSWFLQKTHKPFFELVNSLLRKSNFSLHVILIFVSLYVEGQIKT